MHGDRVLSTADLCARLPDVSKAMVYRHVDLLASGGILEVAEERRVRGAVERRYLAGEAAQRAAHASLASTFATYPLGPRVIDELPWQQLAAGDVGAMAATLAARGFTEMAHRQSHTDLRRLWRRAEEAGHRVVDGYRPIVDDPGSDAELAWAVARLVSWISSSSSSPAGRVQRGRMTTRST